MLENKVVVVTGGAGLIGRSFIEAIVNNGGIAVIADINSELGESAKLELSSALNSRNIDFVSLDITSKSSISQCIAYSNEKYGHIDALVNNAYPRNTNYGRHFLDVEYEDFCENVNFHLGGYFLCSQQFVKYFQTQGHGNIVNMSSIYGIIAPKFEIYQDTQMTVPVEYAVIKSGLLHFTKYLAKYCKGLNIKVNAISPGGIFDSQPKSFLDKYNSQCSNKGMLDKGDLRGTLIYLLSDMSKYVNGQNIIVDDGFCL